MSAPQKLGMYKIGSFEVEIYKAVQFGNCPPYYYYLNSDGSKTALNQEQFNYLEPVK